MNTRVIIWGRTVAWTKLLRLGVCIVAALAITNLGLPQPITGVLVNALLLWSVEWVGVKQAILVGMITPLGAALHGILPLPLMVMIPFIALGNATLVSLYDALRPVHRGLALVVAAFAKFALLYAAVTVLIVRPLTLVVAGNPQAVAIPEAMVNMMRWPQLATALVGGMLALGMVGVHNLWSKKR